MIGRIKGTVEVCANDHVIVDVGGVGYLIYCSLTTLSNLIVYSKCELYIVTHVREDHIHLYGFITNEEKEYFTLLQSVNGIGARMALAILSALNPSQINNAIISKDKDIFKAISGVGTKLAERILIELKDKIKIDNAKLVNQFSNKTLENNDIATDAISALSNLGMNKIIAHNLIHKIMSTKPSIQIDELIRLALRERS